LSAVGDEHFLWLCGKAGLAVIAGYGLTRDGEAERIVKAVLQQGAVFIWGKSKQLQRKFRHRHGGAEREVDHILIAVAGEQA